MHAKIDCPCTYDVFELLMNNVNGNRLWVFARFFFDETMRLMEPGLKNYAVGFAYAITQAVWQGVQLSLMSTWTVKLRSTSPAKNWYCAELAFSVL